MKRLIALIFILIITISFSACKKDPAPAQDTPSNEHCTQQDIRMLMERNLDCYYLFYVAPISEISFTDSDGYSKVNSTFFASYAELCEFVESTYTAEKAFYLLNEYPSAKEPLYFEKNSDFYVNLNVVEPVTYEIMWDDTYTIEFIDNSNEVCTFELSTTDFDGNPYTTSGKAVMQNGDWVLTDIIY